MYAVRKMVIGRKYGFEVTPRNSSIDRVVECQSKAYTASENAKSLDSHPCILPRREDERNHKRPPSSDQVYKKFDYYDCIHIHCEPTTLAEYFSSVFHMLCAGIEERDSTIDIEDVINEDHFILMCETLVREKIEHVGEIRIRNYTIDEYLIAMPVTAPAPIAKIINSIGCFFISERDKYAFPYATFQDQDYSNFFADSMYSYLGERIVDNFIEFTRICSDLEISSEKHLIRSSHGTPWWALTARETFDTNVICSGTSNDASVFTRFQLHAHEDVELCAIVQRNFDGYIDLDSDDLQEIARIEDIDVLRRNLLM